MLIADLTGVGVAAFWVVLLIRLPEMLRQKEFRSMYFSVVTLGLSVTLYYQPIALLLAELFGSAKPCNIGMNLWGVLTSGVVAALVARELRPDAVKLVYGLTAAGLAVIAVMGQTVSHGSIGCATNLNLPWWDVYWWVLCTAWASSMAWAVFLCVKSIQAASRIPALTATMYCFLIGFASSLLFWVGIWGFLVFRPAWVLAALPIVLLFHIWFHTVGLSIGVAAAAVGRFKKLRSMHQRLWLLAHLEKLEQNPSAGAVSMHAGLWKDFARNTRLGLYRAEVQILDSLAVLEDQIAVAVGESPSSSKAAAIVEFYHSTEGRGMQGAVVFDTLAHLVRELNEGNEIRGDFQDWSGRRHAVAGHPGVH